MVLMYKSRRLVDHEGDARSIDPFTGRVRSILVTNKLVPRRDKNTTQAVHCVNTCPTEGLHACVVVQGCVNAVCANGVDFQLLKVGQVAGASATIGQRVNEAGWFSECIAGTSDDSAFRNVIMIS